MLKLLLTDEFAAWFEALDDAAAEDIATHIDLVKELGPARAPDESHESLLWYEHADVSRGALAQTLGRELEEWGGFREYTRRVLDELESPRFVKRLARLTTSEATAVVDRVKAIRRAADPRSRWRERLARANVAPSRSVGTTEEVRRLYLEALEAGGLAVEDVPTHSLALREICRRSPDPGFRLIYGVDLSRETAVFVLGERLDRDFYGDSVQKAERRWTEYLGGSLRSISPSPSR